jgi:hypothetical protein
MNLKINDDLSIDIWSKGQPPFYIHLYLSRSQTTLSVFECKCLINALELIIKENDKAEKKGGEK